MILLSQRNPVWAAAKLGASNLIVGRYGCTTTCLAMLSNYFKCYMSPSKIASNKGWYTPEGLIIWQKLNFEHMAFDKRIKGQNDYLIRDSLKDPNKAVMLEVNNGSHWVVAIRNTLFGKSYIVGDPWNGDTCDVIKRYHNITGSAHFIKK